MMDALTRDKWRFDFCFAAVKLGLDVACTIDHENGAFVWHSTETSEHWHAYKLGREHQFASVPLLTLPVRSPTDWHSVNAIARGLG